MIGKLIKPTACTGSNGRVLCRQEISISSREIGSWKNLTPNARKNEGGGRGKEVSRVFGLSSLAIIRKGGGKRDLGEVEIHRPLAFYGKK